MPILTSGPSRFLGGSRAPAAPVPVAGEELWLNGIALVDDNADGIADGWTVRGTPTIVTGNGFSGRAQREVQASSYTDIGNFAKTRGIWYFVTGEYRSSQPLLLRDGITTYASLATNAGSAAAFLLAWRQINAGSLTGLFTMSGTNGVTYAEVGNVSVKAYTLASLLSTRPYASANCDLSVAVTRTAGTQAGLCARLDSAASPANFLIAYLDGAGNVKVDKCVGGTYTAVITGAVTYVAGRVLRLVCSGNDVSVYYNGVQVGSTTAVADAGIVSNTRHGLFSTYAANTFTGYTAA